MSWNIDAFRGRGICIPGPTTPEQEATLQKRRESMEHARDKRERLIILQEHDE